MKLNIHSHVVPRFKNVLIPPYGFVVCTERIGCLV